MGISFWESGALHEAVWTLSVCICAVGCRVLFNTQDYCVLGAVCDVMDMLGVTLFCKSLRWTCSHYWLIVVSLPSGLFVLYKCAVFYCIVFILIKLWLNNYLVLTWTLRKWFGVSGWFFQKSLTLWFFFFHVGLKIQKSRSMLKGYFNIVNL